MRNCYSSTDLMQSSSSIDTWICSVCSNEHRHVELKKGESASCVRCGSNLNTRPRTGPSLGLAWASTALLMFLIAAGLPILEVSKFGSQHQATLLVAQQGFTETGMTLMGSISGLFVFWFPVVVSATLVILNTATLRKDNSIFLRFLLRLLQFARRWAMPEVFLLAVMIAFIKIGDLAETHPKSGLWFLLAGTLFLLASIQRIERDSLDHRFLNQSQKPTHKSHALSFSLMLSALLLLIPANLLPILEMRLPGNHGNQTIIGGVKTLLEHNMWGVALVVFAASVIVPFAKIAGLSRLLWIARNGSGSKSDMKLYSLLEKVGRWSMLDVFLVALLAGLIHFGQLAEIRPGAATPAFAAAVILTTLAVEQFDTRRLWNALNK